MATVPNLQNVGASIAARLSALENNNGFVTQEALDSALEGKLDKTGIAVAATKATQDSDGNPIKSTYATKEELNTKQDKGDYLTTGTANTTYLKKADAQTTYLGVRAKAASAATADSATKATQDGAGNVIADTYLTKTAAATTYLGISSKAKSAETADSATKATQDGNGAVIATTYVKRVNGAVPDSNGNVTVDSGGVKKVNSVDPDASGNVDLYIAGTEDLVAGESALETGKLYFVYE